MKKLIIWGAGGLAAAAVLFLIGRTLFQDPHVKEGHALFEYYCAHCHGTKGRGDGFNADNMDPRPRDLTDRVEEYMAGASNEEIYDVISRDVKLEDEVTDPDEFWVPGAMPTFKYTLSDKERWELVAFIRTLHSNDADPIEFTEEMESKRPTIEVTDPPQLSDLPPGRLAELVKQGKFLYNEKFICSSCHRIGDEGGTVGPELSRAGFRLNPKWIYRWTKAPQAIKHETKMPSFGMSNDEALAITAYLNTLRAPAAPPES